MFSDFRTLILPLARPNSGASPTGGRGGHEPRTFENRGDSPQKFGYFSIFFLEAYIFFIFHHFQNKVAEIHEEKLDFLGVGGFVCL